MSLSGVVLVLAVEVVGGGRWTEAIAAADLVCGEPCEPDCLVVDQLYLIDNFGSDFGSEVDCCLISSTSSGATLVWVLKLADVG